MKLELRLTARETFDIAVSTSHELPEGKELPRAIKAAVVLAQAISEAATAKAAWEIVSWLNDRADTYCLTPTQVFHLKQAAFALGEICQAEGLEKPVQRGVVI